MLINLPFAKRSVMMTKYYIPHSAGNFYTDSSHNTDICDQQKNCINKKKSVITSYRKEVTHNLENVLFPYIDFTIKSTFCN